MDGLRSNKLLNILVVVLVLAIVGEAGYYLYTRYVGSVKSPLKDLSTSETRDQEITSADQFAQGTDLENSGELVIRQVSQEKLDNFVGIFDFIPPEMLARSQATITFRGTVAEWLEEELASDELIYVYKMRLVSTKSEDFKLRFTQSEIDNMTVDIALADDNRYVAGKYNDISVGDEVLVTITTDLLEWRGGRDNVNVKIRRDHGASSGS